MVRHHLKYLNYFREVYLYINTLNYMYERMYNSYINSYVYGSTCPICRIVATYLTISFVYGCVCVCKSYVRFRYKFILIHLHVLTTRIIINMYTFPVYVFCM